MIILLILRPFFSRMLPGRTFYREKTRNNKRRKLYNSIICSNCGKYGHIYKKCFSPVTSFGIICFKQDNPKPINKISSKRKWNMFNLLEESINVNENDNIDINFKYLLVQRKDSFSFAELVRVKYNVRDKKYIKKILSKVSKEERDFLKNAQTPGELWNRLWIFRKKTKARSNEYERIKGKLKSLIEGVHDKNGIIFNLKSLIDEIEEEIKSGKLNGFRDFPEWGFPKGRRVPKESNLQCAVREFCEETNIDKSNITILHSVNPLEEIFTGSNNVLYKHVYYVAEMKNIIDISVDPSNFNQISEIRDIQWFSKNETIEKLEEENKERVLAFKKVSGYLEKL